MGIHYQTRLLHIFISSGPKDTFSEPQIFTMLKFFKNEHSKISAADEHLNEKKFDEIKVIGAGLPRTGTLSLKTALTQLYGGKCYHMMNVFSGKQEDVDIWIRAFKEEIPSEEWRKFFSERNYACGVDFPFSMHYKQLMKAYPDAKVVLSVRDPKTWYTSVFTSIYQIGLLMEKHPTAKWLVQQIDRRRPCTHDMIDIMDSRPLQGCKASFRGAIEGGPEESERLFNDWVAEVKRSVPADRLLVHSAKEGWTPLCNFLGLPIPEGSYPRVNDAASIASMVNKLWWVNCIIFYCLPTATAVAVGCFYRADLAVGYDLAPLSWSTLAAIKSLVSAGAAKFGL